MQFVDVFEGVFNHVNCCREVRDVWNGKLMDSVVSEESMLMQCSCMRSGEEVSVSHSLDAGLEVGSCLDYAGLRIRDWSVYDPPIGTNALDDRSKPRRTQRGGAPVEALHKLAVDSAQVFRHAREGPYWPCMSFSSWIAANLLGDACFVGVLAKSTAFNKSHRTAAGTPYDLPSRPKSGTIFGVVVNLPMFLNYMMVCHNLAGKAANRGNWGIGHSLASGRAFSRARVGGRRGRRKPDATHHPRPSPLL